MFPFCSLSIKSLKLPLAAPTVQPSVFSHSGIHGEQHINIVVCLHRLRVNYLDCLVPALHQTRTSPVLQSAVQQLLEEEIGSCGVFKNKCQVGKNTHIIENV